MSGNGGIGDELNKKISSLEGVFIDKSQGMTAEISINHPDWPSGEKLCWCRIGGDLQIVVGSIQNGGKPLLECPRIIRVVAADFLSNLWDEIDKRVKSVEASVVRATAQVDALTSRLKSK